VDGTEARKNTPETVTLLNDESVSPTKDGIYNHSFILSSTPPLLLLKTHTYTHTIVDQLRCEVLPLR
jgi:hypothetical protein